MELDLFGRPYDPSKKLRGNLNVRLDEADWDRLILLKHHWEHELGRILTVTEVTRAALAVAHGCVKNGVLTVAPHDPLDDPPKDPPAAPPDPPPAEPPPPEPAPAPKRRKGAKK